MSEDLVAPQPLTPSTGPSVSGSQSGSQSGSESGIRSRLSRFGSQRSGESEIDPLLKTLRKYHPKSDTKVVERAYVVARDLHLGQKRKSG